MICWTYSILAFQNTESLQLISDKFMNVFSPRTSHFGPFGFMLVDFSGKELILIINVN